MLGSGIWQHLQALLSCVVFACCLQARECWAVAFGNSYNDEERCVLAGYDNGDVKMFDLRMNSIRWQANVGNGVCGVQFDRQDIEMNKFAVTCLESIFKVRSSLMLCTSMGLVLYTATQTSSVTLFFEQLCTHAHHPAWCESVLSRPSATTILWVECIILHNSYGNGGLSGSRSVPSIRGCLLAAGLSLLTSYRVTACRPDNVARRQSVRQLKKQSTASNTSYSPSTM